MILNYQYVLSDYLLFSISASIAIKPIDVAIALNSPSNVMIEFMNVNNMVESVKSITANPGDEVKLVCGAIGNPDGYEKWKWTWSWEITTFYTELVGCTKSGTCTLTNPQTISHSTSDQG